MSPKHKARWRKLGQIGLGIAIAVSALIAFGISGADDAAFRSFDEATACWQANPEFRAVAIDYCVRGSRAMRTRPLMIPSTRLIIALRSLPLLPSKFAVNQTSRLHYRNFTRGPLCAYLHLCSEQQVAQYVGIFESIGHRSPPGDSDLRELLNSFQMDFPTCKDAGAMHSAGSLLHDAEAYRTFAIRQNIGPLLLPYIAALSQELQLPTDAQDQTPDQQQAVLDRLDRYVKDHDLELWRTKQLSDFCGGIWAQVFSPPYGEVIEPILLLHQMATITLVLLLGIWIVRLRQKPSPPTSSQTA
jgi:hypothetical protein